MPAPQPESPPPPSSKSRSRRHRRSPLSESIILWAVCVLIVAAIHTPFLGLPFFWDEAGYYVPAALDLAQHGTLIPRTTSANPHPPLLPLYLAGAYLIFGTGPYVTHLAMSVVAGTAVFSLLMLAMLVVPSWGGIWAAALFIFSPLFFAQSSLAQLDVAATAATLMTLYFALRGKLGMYLLAGTVLCLTRETGVVVILAAAVLARRPVMLLPIAPLLGWFGFLKYATGHWLGDPGFVAYNVWTTLNPLRFLWTLLRRLHFLFFVDFRWLLIPSFALSWIGPTVSRRPAAVGVLWWMLGAQVLVMSLFGGAILNRYLLPALAIAFLLAVEAGERAPIPALRGVRREWFLAPFLVMEMVCWFWNPPYPFPYDDNLAYVDFVGLHQTAFDRLNQMAPDVRVLTAWPASDELRRPELGYLGSHGPAKVIAMPDFSEDSFKSVQREDFDVVLMYSREWEPPWSLMKRLPGLMTLRQDLYGFRPQASLDWVQNRFRLNHSGAIYLHGQWIVWLQRDDYTPPTVTVEKAISMGLK